MIGHDQLFKDLLRTFFPGFLRLAVPEAAGRVDGAEVRFLETEGFTGIPEGERRQLDLLAEVQLRGSPEAEGETALVNVEIEARASAGIGPRLDRYAMQVRLRHAKPVLSLLLTLQGGPPGPRAESVVEQPLGLESNRFRYYAFGLEKCRAADYLAHPEPLAWAFAALMRSEESRAAHRLACLRPIAAATGLDKARRFLLVNCVTTYLQLDEFEAAEYEALEAAEENREVREMEMTWAETLMAKGEKRGEEKGRAEGVRETVLRQLGRRFGPLPEEARRRVEAISSTDALARLADQVLDARSLEEMGLA